MTERTEDYGMAFDKLEYNKEYNKKNGKRVVIDFYKNDADIYDYLKYRTNKSGYIKQLIRDDMQRSGAYSPFPVKKRPDAPYTIPEEWTLLENYKEYITNSRAAKAYDELNVRVYWYKDYPFDIYRIELRPDFAYHELMEQEHCEHSTVSDVLAELYVMNLLRRCCNLEWEKRDEAREDTAFWELLDHRRSIVFLEHAAERISHPVAPCQLVKIIKEKERCINPPYLEKLNVRFADYVKYEHPEETNKEEEK